MHDLKVENYVLFNTADESADLRPGHSISDNSEKLLQRGRGKRRYISDFGKGWVHAIKHVFFCRKFLLVS